MRAKRVKRPAGCQSLTLALFMIAGLVTPALGQQRSPGYSEVGMSVTKFEDAMFVYNVFVQGPADEAKIQAGEFITHVDGVETKDMSVEEFVQKVGGETGSEVEFTVKQTEYLLPAPRTVKITREPVTPFTFQARTTSGESFDAAVQGPYFFSGNKSAPDREDRKYSAVFDAFIPFEYIYSEIHLSFEPSDHVRTVPLHITYHSHNNRRDHSFDVNQTIQPGWKHLYVWFRFATRGLIHVEMSSSGLLIAKGAYVWE